MPRHPMVTQRSQQTLSHTCGSSTYSVHTMPNAQLGHSSDHKNIQFCEGGGSDRADVSPLKQLFLKISC